MSLTRVPTYMTRSILVDRMNQVQQRLNMVQTQVTTEKKSQNYTGIAEHSFRLISFESQTTRVQQFINNNELAATRFQSVTDSLSFTETSVRSMRNQLNSFMQRDPNGWTQEHTNDFKQLQNSALGALKDLEYYLNSDVDGHYLFGGGKTAAPPVDIGYKTLEEFQAVYDGVNTTFPETRAANLSNFKSTPTNAAAKAVNTFVSGSAIETVTGTDHGTITYDAGTDRLTAATTGAFSNFRVGDKIAVEDPDNPGNSGLFTVTAIDTTNGDYLEVDGDITTATTSPDAVVKRLTRDNITPGDYDGAGLTFTAAPPPPAAQEHQLVDPGANSPFADLAAGNTVKIGDGTGLTGTYTVTTKTDDDTITLTKVSGDDLADMDMTALRIILDPPPTEDFGTLTFDGRPNSDDERVVGRLTSSVAGYFSSYEVGMTLTVSGTAADIYGEPVDNSQDGTSYKIVGISKDGSTLEVDPSFPGAGGGLPNHGPVSFDTADFDITLTASRQHGSIDNGTYVNAGTITQAVSPGTDIEVTNDLTASLAAGDKVTVIDGAGNIHRHLELDTVAAGALTFTNNVTFSGSSTYQIMKERTDTPPFVTGQLTESNFGTLSIDATAGTIGAGKTGAFAGLSHGMTIMLDDNTNVGDADYTGNHDAFYTITGISDDKRTITVEPSPAASGTITSGTGAVMRIGVPEGTRIKVDNSASNDDYYTVAWPSPMDTDDKAAVLAGEKLFTREALTTETLPAGTTVEARSYYRGDNLVVTHQADQHRQVTMSANAADPAIDKAIRGLGILAQGVPKRPDGTPDPIELQRRLEKARALLGDAMQHPAGSAEAASDLSSLQQRLGFEHHAVVEATKQQTSLMAFLDARVAEIENVDMLEAVALMQDEMRALEVSYQTFSRISQLSLSKYL